LDPPPKYNAVSYVWGQDDPSGSHNVSINGTLMPVRPNIWHFLEQMRKETFEDLLWIDAICINQGDIAERGHQVAVMGQIYEKAAEVQAWLGAANEPVQQAMRMVCVYWSEESSPNGERSGNDSKAMDGDSGTNNAVQTLKHKSQVQDFIDPVRVPPIDDLVIISHIWSCDYWSRLWIVPEFLLAKELTIRCGSLGIPSRSLEDLAGSVSTKEYRDTHKKSDRVSALSHGPGPRIVYTRAKRYRDRLSPGLSWLTELSIIIAILGQGDCADERDRIYAFLPLDKKALKMIKPDYSKTTSQVFEELYDAQTNTALEGLAPHVSVTRLLLSAVARLLGLDARSQEIVIEMGKDSSRPRELERESKQLTLRAISDDASLEKGIILNHATK
jgi:hypothetical protein